MEDRWMLVATVTIGAILMYLFDAFTGLKRRAWLRQHFITSIHRSRDALAAAWRDVRHEARDLFDEARMLFRKL